MCERARERETRFEMRKKERTEEHEALPSFINRKDFPLLRSLTSGCVSCVGCPTSSSNEGSEANEREEEGFGRREEEEKEEVVVGGVAADRMTERALATSIDGRESFAAEAAAAANRLAMSIGLPAVEGAIATKQKQRGNEKGLFRLSLPPPMPLWEKARSENSGAKKKKKRNIGPKPHLPSSQLLTLSIVDIICPRRPLKRR